MSVNKVINLSSSMRAISQNIITGEGILSGVYVDSTSSGTAILYDNTSAAGTLMFSTFTPATGYHNLGEVRFNAGCYLLTTGTLTATWFIRIEN